MAMANLNLFVAALSLPEKEASAFFVGGLIEMKY